MSKEEAIELMKQGVKMTHKYFVEGEWAYMGLNGLMVLEDGVEVEPHEFWQYRQDVAWNNNWEKFNPTKR